MASKYDFGGKSSRNFAQSFVNIDTLCSVYATTQQSLGQTPVFKEKGEIDKKGENTESSETQTSHGCDCRSCEKSCGKSTKKYDFSLNGLFGDGHISEEDDDQDYICEYCGALGYKQKYIPEICDSCTQCSTCTEYINDECSGCSYSIYRDGTYYRDKMSEKDLFDETDLEMFESIKLDQKGGNWAESNKFTINKL